MFKLFCLILLNAVIFAHARRECIHRDFGTGSTVCVCNITYCDNLPQIARTAKGIITLYETSKDGDRFKETRLKFGDQDSTIVAKTQIIEIDHDIKHQKIVGFGGAFTDAAGINIAALPNTLQYNLIGDYFSKEGIEYTLGRIPIGGSDFSTRGYSYDDTPGDDNLTHFKLTDEDNQYKLPYLRLAQLMSPHEVKYFGSPWSPPAWIKNNNKLTNGGYLIGKPGEKYYKIFANYFVKFLDAYKSNGVDIWGLTIENEPGAGDNANYLWNSLGFTPELQRDFLKLDLGPILESAGYGAKNVKLMIHDDQRPTVAQWADVILNDKEATKYVWGNAFHWYASNPQNIENLDKAHAAHPMYPLISTEACEEWSGKAEKVSLGNWHTFDRYAYDIITDLNHWVSGWVDWNLALDLKGGPNWVGNFVDAPIIVDNNTEVYYKQPFFYGLGHFSKFLIPDSVRVEVTRSHNVSNFETTAFERPDSSVVVIALNMNNDSVLLTIDDSTNGVLTRVVKPHSLQTYIWYH